MKTSRVIHRFLTSILLFGLLGAGAIPLVWAQQPSSGGIIEEVIVTAQKRVEKIQDGDLETGLTGDI